MARVHLHRHSPVSVAPTSSPSIRAAGGPWWWLVGAALVLFAIPFVGTDLLGLQPDLYYLGYFTIALVGFAAFLGTYGEQLQELWRVNWAWSLVVGAAAGVVVAMVVFGSAGTGHPEGWRWWFEIAWRGVVYGGVDTLTLFVFPGAVAYLVMHGDRNGVRRRIGFAGLALALSLVVSTSYHLGYDEYRDADLRSPLIGTVLASSATMLTGNPLGAFLTHGTAHVSAVVHQEQGGPTRMLPPKAGGDYPSRGDSDLAAGLAAGWLLVMAGAVTLVVRHRRTAP